MNVDMRERHTESMREQLLTAIRGAWSTQPTCWDQQVDAVMAVGDEELEQVQAERDALAVQVAAVRTLITEDYGTDYDDEDVPAAIERLMRHLSEYEADVRRILQSKSEAIERAEAERDRLKATEQQIREKVAGEILADVAALFVARIGADLWEAAYRAARVARGE